MINDALFSSEGSNYVLPEHVVMALHKEFKFTGAIGGVTRKLEVPRISVKEALDVRWGRVGSRFLVNPPDFGSTLIPWLTKAVQESQLGTTIVVSAPARTDTNWFATYGTNAHEVRLIKGRIRHEHTASSAPFPTMFLVYRASERLGSKLNVSLWTQDGEKLA